MVWTSHPSATATAQAYAWHCVREDETDEGKRKEKSMLTVSPIGRFTHCVFICFGLFTNILVTAMLLTGGSAVVTSLTGMPTAAACFLLPVGVVMYTMFGG
jgi:hypothetical protein